MGSFTTEEALAAEPFVAVQIAAVPATPVPSVPLQLWLAAEATDMRRGFDR